MGQQFKFKNLQGDSIVYVVDSVKDYFHPEYEYPFIDSVKLDDAESYVAHLSASDEIINFAFYKTSQYSDPAKLNQTILWPDMAGQFIEIENIKYQVPFTAIMINNKTYSKVSAAIPITYTQNPWTKWNGANYDQAYGLIELIDLKGVYWERQ